MWTTIPNFYYDFNPRLQEGGDLIPTRISLVVGISIHASKKEATFARQNTILWIDISIHASKKEATNLLLLFLNLR